MFLNYLEEDNKERFLKVCIHAALANGLFEEEEKDMLGAYCREMDIEEHIPETSESFDKLLKEIFDNATMVERKIFTLEVLALVQADGVYDEDEKNFMEKLTSNLGISDDILLKLNGLLEKYLEVGADMYSLIFE